MHYSTHLLRHVRATIGQNIQYLRVQRKLTLRKLSRMTNVPETLLDQYELGKNEIRLEALLKIACAMNVEVKNLIE